MNVGLVIAEARSWLGTPYHHAADVKGPQGGVDCAMLLVRVFCDTGTIPMFDPRPYPAHIYLHSDEPRYLSVIQKYGVSVEKPEPGDLAVFKFGKAAAHAGLYVEDDLMIHAFEKVGRVVVSEIQRSPYLARRLVGFWRVAP